MSEILEFLKTPEQWINDALRIVPAPKNQRWRISSSSGLWEPSKRGINAAHLRPLAHVSLKDQVIATAVMLCLANRVETAQGDPQKSIQEIESRRQVISYGNRLFCDTIGSELYHRWGSTKLYRAYYQDYRTFLSRPDVVTQSIKLEEGRRVFIVHSDLRQFYDRVRPDRLALAIRSIQKDNDDPAFFDLAERILNWGWHRRDKSEITIYSEQANLDNFTRVALPQGLVSAGFFANVVLLRVDNRLKCSIGTEIAPGVYLYDTCRYVDDLRMVFTVEQGYSIDSDNMKSIFIRWMNGILKIEVPGLIVSDEKTKVAEIGGTERPIVRQSTKMTRIQSAVSGGFDAIGGEDILDAIQGLMRSQEALRSHSEETGWRFTPLSDVRDETVARFASARFRSTYRSIRPLLEETRDVNTIKINRTEAPRVGHGRPNQTQGDLDEDARTFALGLIERWINDPSNVRLLRIGLDLWPDASILKAILALIRPYTEKGGRRKAPRRVAWYCLAEIFRAGATETGFVDDNECLPANVNLDKYRAVLCDEAVRLVSLPAPTIPWYLRQQAFLFLASFDPQAAPVIQTGRSFETKHYRELIRFLRGEGNRLKSSDFATLAILSRRAFCDENTAVALTLEGLTSARKKEIAARDPSYVLELNKQVISLFEDLPLRVRDDLCLDLAVKDIEKKSLADVILNKDSICVLRNELVVLRFSAAFLKQLMHLPNGIEVVTPGQVWFKLTGSKRFPNFEQLEIIPGRISSTGSIYNPPAWCPPEERWRFHLGFLLRFILARQADFTRTVRKAHWKEKESVYRKVESHWYQRLYGFYNYQSAFGDDWLPITDWTEQFLSSLLHWPGCRFFNQFKFIKQGIQATLDEVNKRVLEIEGMQGRATSMLILRMVTKRPTMVNNERPLRACVIQTAIPGIDDFHLNDLTLSGSYIRRKHRNHLSAALAAVERMLALRETHKGIEGRLDWLILPELAVHPNDITTHLVPFSRAHRTLILAGMVYEELMPGEPLVNSALWVIPEWSDSNGLQIRTRRQGKLHLAPEEQSLNTNSLRLQGFRPCQWLIGYPWSNDQASQPIWLTASVCYDATDLGLAADLRAKSDIYAILALNRDIKTFDQMALALHYHMFQLVVIANNGQYGGSNAYWPSCDQIQRQIFHLHGQPQASIAFLEIEDIAAFLNRYNDSCQKNNKWKHPPAGLGD